MGEKIDFNKYSFSSNDIPIRCMNDIKIESNSTTIDMLKSLREISIAIEVSSQPLSFIKPLKRLLKQVKRQLLRKRIAYEYNKRLL